MAAFRERILHVDMDAFFVEVERRRDPTLVGVPVIVGGGGARGVVASASYEARRRGVRSAMPVARARRLCPGARLVPPDHRAYQVASGRVFEVLASFTPHVEGVSVDEAFLDIAGLRLHHPEPAAVGHALRAAIRTATDLPASVGIATSKLVAKLASEEAKPDGLLLIPAGTELGFLHPLPVRRLWGVGEATQAALEEFGVATIGDLASVPLPALCRRLGDAGGRHLHDLAAGIDPRPVVVGGEAKTISVEETYDVDLPPEPGALERELLRLSDRLSGRLRRAGQAGRTVAIKVRTRDFVTHTRSVTLAEPVAGTNHIWREAVGLLSRIDLSGRPVRLLGVGLGHLTGRGGPGQLAFDGGEPPTEGVIDQVRARFGDDAIRPARLIEGGDPVE